MSLILVVCLKCPLIMEMSFVGSTIDDTISGKNELVVGG